MDYYKKQPQMTLSDRLAIEVGIERKESFKPIAERLNRHPSTIAHEVKENRTFIQGNYPGGNDCKFARQCTVQHICGLDEDDKKFLDDLVTKLVRKGQPLSHIYAEHENEMPVSLRSLYNYIMPAQ